MIDDQVQPHQVGKKRHVWARMEGLRQAGHLTLTVSGLRIEALAWENSPQVNQPQIDGIQERLAAGKITAPPARPEKQSL